MDAEESGLGRGCGCLTRIREGFDTAQDFRLVFFPTFIQDVEDVKRSGYERKSDFKLGVPLENRASKAHPADEALSPRIELLEESGASRVRLGKQVDATLGEVRRSHSHLDFNRIRMHGPPARSLDVRVLAISPA